MEKVRLGIIGCGDIAHKKFLPAIKELEKCQLVKVCDINEEVAKRTAGNTVSWCTDYKELLKQSDIDAVIITTPHPFHAEVIIAAAKAHKHILVEKPMAISQKEIDAIVQIVSKNKIKFLPLPFFISPAYSLAKELLNAGYIGEITGAEASTVGSELLPSSWYLSRFAGGGAILDLGVYSISTVIGLLGPAANVSAMLSRGMSEVIMSKGKKVPLEQEDNGRIILKWENRSLASIFCGWMQGWSKNMITITGREGALILNGWQNDSLYIYSQKALSVDYDNVEILGYKMYRPILPIGKHYGIPPLEYFIDAILNDKNLTLYAQIQRHVIEIVLKAYESARKKQVVNLITGF
ncbi:MAG: Gfo/Idh/MocA family oxidoreductase [Candidatus Firestonebacteria bacterium]